MKNIYKVFVLIPSIFIASSCEEVIEIDLNSTNPLIVAEGSIENDSVARLNLSYTSDYFDSEASVKIEDAIVSLSNDEGFIENLEHTTNGIYVGKEKAVKGQTYKLEFKYNEQVYSASTYINNPSEVLEVQFEEMEMKHPGESNAYSAKIFFSDEQYVHNHYMFKFLVNNEPENDRYYLVDDNAYTDNGIIEFEPKMLMIEKDAEVKIVVYSIDEDTYVYYNQLNDNAGGEGGMGSTSTPYNPESNFGADVLGYFAGWSSCEYFTEVN